MVKAKRITAGTYELSYKGQTTVINRRPDQYFDLSLGDQPPVKGYLKDHKARFQAWVDGPSASPPQPQEPAPAAPPAKAAPSAPPPPPPAEEPPRRDRAAVLREAPPDSEPGVTMSVHGWDANQLLRSHGARRAGDLITLVFENYHGHSVKVTMSVAAAVRHVERVEAMVLQVQKA